MTRRSALLILLCLATLALPSVSPAEEEDPCRLAEDAPAYICGGGGTIRDALVSAQARGMWVTIWGFEFTGVVAPQGSTSDEGACVSIYSYRAHFTECNLPFEVTVDPLLETASIKGSVADRRRGGVGRIDVDLTFEGSGDLEPSSAGAAAFATAGCSDEFIGTGAGTPARQSTVAGRLVVGRTRVGLQTAEAALYSGVTTAEDAAVASPCAEGRGDFYPGSAPSASCFGAGADGPVVYSCWGSALVKRAEVTGNTRSAKVRVTGYEMTFLTPFFDPNYIDPVYFVPGSFSYACVFMTGRGWGMGICGAPFDVEFDPALRTAHIQGEFESPFDYFPPGPGSGFPIAFDYGRIYIDLTLTADGGTGEADGRTSLYSGTTCEFGAVGQETRLLSAPASATGYVAFKKRHGSARGTAARPLPASMSQRMATGVDSYLGGCGSSEEPPER